MNPTLFTSSSPTNCQLANAVNHLIAITDHREFLWVKRFFHTTDIYFTRRNITWYVSVFLSHLMIFTRNMKIYTFKSFLFSSTMIKDHRLQAMPIKWIWMLFCVVRIRFQAYLSYISFYHLTIYLWVYKDNMEIHEEKVDTNTTIFVFTEFLLRQFSTRV